MRKQAAGVVGGSSQVLNVLTVGEKKKKDTLRRYLLLYDRL